MLKVFMEPYYDPQLPDRSEGGIRRVVEALIKYLPQFDVEVTTEIRKADLSVGHGVMAPIKPDIPFVSVCHGLHWSDYTWHNWAREVNRAVVEALVRAEAVTAPSQWVAGALSRGMLVSPTVIHHGVEPEEWEHKLSADKYVLWNKARQDPVSDAGDMQQLAARLPDVRFVSTLGTETENVKVVGVKTLPEMKPLIQQAALYLATARETFGIGTLEALASGVPVVGWDYGGQSEIVRNGETGYLVEYGDYAALADRIHRAFAERRQLSRNAVEDVRVRWQWPDKIERYAALYQRVVGEWHTPRPRVSVIVTCHNLKRFLDEALRSVQRQTLTDWECLVVDDASTDGSDTLAQEWAQADPRFQLHRTPRNLKLSGARNFGFAQARGKYIVHLDADDVFPPEALALLADALDRDPGLHIAYGTLDTMSEDGTNRRGNEWPGDFYWSAQMAHINQIHTGAMVKRSVLERSGGYRERMWRAEDAEFWCRVTSFGFRAAKVTTEPTLIYRIRQDSKGATEYRTYPDHDGDWGAWFPWSSADEAHRGAAWLREHPGQVVNAPLVPFGAQGEPPNNRKAWDVWHHQQPLVSVIIPVGPGHRRYVLDALDSLIAQDVKDWEAIVVNDSGEEWDSVPGAPFAQVVHTNGKQGPGAARNMGLAVARGDLVLFLDADDWLLPGALRKMLTEYTRVDSTRAGVGSYIYTDYVEVDANWNETPKQVPDYAQGEWRGQHAITVLMAKDHARQVGGFDEQLPGWEDWDFFTKCSIAGICGKRIAEPLFAYRFSTGTRREGDLHERSTEILPQLRERYAAYYTGAKAMASCCGGNGKAVQLAKMALAEPEPVQAQSVEAVRAPEPADSGTVRLEYSGDRVGAVTYTVNGRAYRGGNNPHNKFVNAQPEDVDRLLSLGVWRVVPRKAVAPPAPPPVPIPSYVPPPAPAAEPPKNGHAAETVPVETSAVAAPAVQSELAKNPRRRSKKP